MSFLTKPHGYYALAVILFAVGANFVNTHCTITMADWLQLAAAIAAGIGGYFHGKSN